MESILSPSLSSFLTPKGCLLRAKGTEVGFPVFPKGSSLGQCSTVAKSGREKQASVFGESGARRGASFSSLAVWQLKRGGKDWEGQICDPPVHLPRRREKRIGGKGEPVWKFSSAMGLTLPFSQKARKRNKKLNF